MTISFDRDEYDAEEHTGSKPTEEEKGRVKNQGRAVELEREPIGTTTRLHLGQKERTPPPNFTPPDRASKVGYPDPPSPRPPPFPCLPGAKSLHFDYDGEEGPGAGLGSSRAGIAARGRGEDAAKKLEHK